MHEEGTTLTTLRGNQLADLSSDPAAACLPGNARTPRAWVFGDTQYSESW